MMPRRRHKADDFVSSCLGDTDGIENVHVAVAIHIRFSYAP